MGPERTPCHLTPVGKAALVFGIGGFFVWIVYRTIWQEERRRLEQEQEREARRRDEEKRQSEEKQESKERDEDEVQKA